MACDTQALYGSNSRCRRSFAAVAYQTFEQTPTYQSNSLILVSNQTAVPVVRSEEASSSEEKVDLSTDIEILRSPTLLARALKKLAVPYNSLSVQQVALNLSINQNQDANVLNVSYTDTDPNRAKVVLEALVSTYLDYGRESQRSPVTNAVRFIEKQLPEAQATLNQSSSALTTFRKNYDLDNPDADAASAFKDKQALQQQTAEAEVSLNQTKQLYQVLQRQMAQAGQTTKTAVIDSVLSQDPTYQNLVSQLKALEVQYILESTRFHQNFPTVEELKERRDEMALLVQEHIERVIGGQKSQAANKILVSGAIQQNLTTQLLQAEINLEVQAGQLNDLRKLEARAATNFQRIVKLQQEYQELQRQNQFASQAVNDFLAKLQELQIREAQEISSWKILEPPYLPTEPTSPPLERGLLLGIVAGILAGVGVAFLLEQADHRLKGLQEIKASIDLPLLGAIPRADLRASTFRRSGVELSYRSDPFTEAIRSLALTLLFQKSSQQSARWGRTLAVTSSIAGEGKTTITYNLGLALAELGRRVLIVDADFNQPFLHKVFGLPNQTGLSTAIATEIPWQELVQAGSPNCRGDISSSQGRHNASQESLGESLNGSSPIFARVLVSPCLTKPLLIEP